MVLQELEQLDIRIAALYAAHFGAAPDYETTQHYRQVFQQLLEEQDGRPAAIENAGKALSDTMYRDSQEGGNVPGMDDEAFVTHLYQIILGRRPDAEGLDYWVNELATGQAERGELVAMMMRAALEYERDGAYVSNRAEVAAAYAQWGNSNPSVLPWVNYTGEDILAGVNENDDSVIAALDRLPASQPRTGDTYELTPERDVIEGTAGDDVINAYWVARDGDATSTLTQGDIIDGGDGTDILNVYADAAGAYNSVMPAGALVRNVEVVNLYNLAADVSELGDASLYEGLEEIWQIGHASAVTNLGRDMIAGFRDLGRDEVVDVQVLNTADQVNIVFDHVSDALWEIFVRAEDSAFSTFTVNIEGTLYVAPYEDGEGPGRTIYTQIFLNDSVETLVVNTAAPLILYGIEDNDTIQRIDARGSAAEVSLTLTHDIESVMLGAGDDSVFLWDFLPSAELILDAGGGMNMLHLSRPSYSADEYAVIRQMQNFQVIRFQNEQLDLDAAQLSIYKNIIVSTDFDGEGDDDEAEVAAPRITVRNLAEDQLLELNVHHIDNGTTQLVLIDPAYSITVEGDGWTTTDDMIDRAMSFLVVESTDGDIIRDTLTLKGWLWMSYDNRDGKFSVIDASQLEEGLDLSYRGTGSDPEHGTGMSSMVQETVVLGDGSDSIWLGVSFNPDVLSSSSYGLMDIIENFTSTATGEARPDFILGVSSLERVDLSDDVSTLEQAFEEAAQNYERRPDEAVNVLFFHFEGDTYLYADTWTAEGAGILDTNDFAIRILGVHDFSDYGLGEVV